jgi:3-phosphoshikimate 1-carboxyvinyltransferase
MCAALAAGNSELLLPLKADDSEAAVRVLGQIGVQFDLGKDIWRVTGDNFQAPEKDLFCGDSAATLRFMCAICGLVPGLCRLTAGKSLSARPVKALVGALQKWGIEIEAPGDLPPVFIKGGSFSGGVTELPGDISSQYVSALLMISPLAGKKSTIWLTTPLESRSYILMTLECLKQFGIHVNYSPELMEYEIAPQRYQTARYKVEGDWSSASYLLALGAIAGQAKVGNLSALSLQGDKELVNILRQMGASVQVSTDDVTVKRKDLKAFHADLSNCIDLLPTAAVLAALAEGTTELHGIQRARLKESNRVKSVKENLLRAGIKVTEQKDRLTIRGGSPQPAVIDSYNDHRIAMAFSLLGAAAGGITIQGAECVSKTYPDYWNVIRDLGVKTNEQ